MGIILGHCRQNFPSQFNGIFYKIVEFQDPNVKKSPMCSFLVSEVFSPFLKLHTNLTHVCMKLIYLLGKKL